jgi:diguanylate cyclase
MGLVARPLTNISDRRLTSVAPAAVLATLGVDTTLVLAVTRWKPSLTIVLALTAVVILQATLLGAIAAYAMSTSPDGRRARHAQRRRVGAAVADGKIVAWFQPIVRASDLTPVGFETLARWNDPARGFVSAQDFVGAADRAGLLASIDRTMIRSASASFDMLITSRGIDKPILTVNVHPRRLEESNFALDLEADLDERGLDGNGLMFEVTETAPITDWATVTDNVAALKKMGIGLAIDDFGSGNANFAFLLRFEPDLVKLDRSLIEAAMASERASAVVGRCVEAARASGAEVLAEGISDVAWIPRLRELGFDYFQGQVFGSAQPATPATLFSHPRAS